MATTIDYLSGTGPFSTRSFIRMSELGACDLNIAHKIRGTEPLPETEEPLPMLFGTALEPVVNGVLLRKGFSIAFAKIDERNEQLEVALEDPYMVGHPDGLIWAETITDWMEKHLPQKALDYLMSGEVLLHEVKTMGASTWKSVVANGLAAGTFTKKYLLSVNAYMRSLQATPAEGELWPDHDIPHPEIDGLTIPVFGYQSFQYVLNEIGRRPPRAALVTCMNVERRSESGLAFELVEFDESIISTRRDELRVVTENYLRKGQLPPPSLDGRAPECFMCRFSHECPATLRIREEEGGLDSISLESPDESTLAELDVLAAEYNANREIAAELTDRQAYLRERMAFLTRGKIITNRFRISLSEVRGREMVDNKALQKQAEEAGWAIPKKRSAPYTTLRVTPLYGPSSDKEE